MSIDTLIPKIEAVLFANAEPIALDRLVEIFEVSANDIDDALTTLGKRLKRSNSGIKLICLENKYQLCTKEEFAQYVKKSMAIKKNTPLSQSALEILAIIAYNQPVTKSFIEQVRGVDCSWTISSLMSKNLIEEQGRLNLPGRPITYGTTDNFLRCFQISSISELPDINSLEGYSEKTQQTTLSLQDEKEDLS